MRTLPCRRVQVDELWGYIYKKQRHLKPTDDARRMGDTWVFMALDAESKLIPSYRVGKRDSSTACAFMSDLASRLSNRVQISSDALAAYVEAIEVGFGAGVDYGRIVKSYEVDAIGPGRYSPPHVVSVERTRIIGKPEAAHISTSYIERANLSVRMGVRRLTRLTNAASKKPENFEAMHLWIAYYNLCRPHATIQFAPAVHAGVTNHTWSMDELLDAAAAN